MELFIGDAIRFFLEVIFRVRYGAPQVRSLRILRVGFYRRTPQEEEGYVLQV